MARRASVVVPPYNSPRMTHCNGLLLFELLTGSWIKEPNIMVGCRHVSRGQAILYVMVLLGLVELLRHFDKDLKHSYLVNIHVQ